MSSSTVSLATRYLRVFTTLSRLSYLKDTWLQESECTAPRPTLALFYSSSSVAPHGCCSPQDRVGLGDPLGHQGHAEVDHPVRRCADSQAGGQARPGHQPWRAAQLRIISRCDRLLSSLAAPRAILESIAAAFRV